MKVDEFDGILEAIRNSLKVLTEAVDLLYGDHEERFDGEDLTEEFEFLKKLPQTPNEVKAGQVWKCPKPPHGDENVMAAVIRCYPEYFILAECTFDDVLICKCSGQIMAGRLKAMGAEYMGTGAEILYSPVTGSKTIISKTPKMGITCESDLGSRNHPRHHHHEASMFQKARRDK